jgi:hypothetical protein
MTPSIFQPKRLSGALLAAALCAPSAHALDLLQTWEQARQHDPQMQVVQATRSSVQAYEAQAQSLWRPVVMGSATVGAMSAETRTTGAQFAVGGQPPMPGSFPPRPAQRCPPAGPCKPNKPCTAPSAKRNKRNCSKPQAWPNGALIWRTSSSCC